MTPSVPSASGSIALKVAISGVQGDKRQSPGRWRQRMSRRKKEPLRPLTDDERDALGQMSRSQVAPAAEVARAKMLLLVASGSDYQGAAAAVGRKSGDAASALVGRFNREGLQALAPRHGGGRRRVYHAPARARILAEARRKPTPQPDGTATWSLSALKRALRGAADLSSTGFFGEQTR